MFNFKYFKYLKIYFCAKKVPTQKGHPQKFNLHNIKLFDFYLNMIHFIFDFYNKYLVYTVSLTRSEMIKLPKPIKEQYYVYAKFKKLMLSSTDTL